MSLVLEEDTYDEIARLADHERVAPAVYARQVLEAHVRGGRHPRAGRSESADPPPEGPPRPPG